MHSPCTSSCTRPSGLCWGRDCAAGKEKSPLRHQKLRQSKGQLRCENVHQRVPCLVLWTQRNHYKTKNLHPNASVTPASLEEELCHLHFDFCGHLAWCCGCLEQWWVTQWPMGHRAGFSLPKRELKSCEPHCSPPLCLCPDGLLCVWSYFHILLSFSHTTFPPRLKSDLQLPFSTKAEMPPKC